jgi:predicted CoA-substrate-specific enzyme activase
VRSVGIDIGSRTVELAVVENGRLVRALVRENSFEPLAVCRELLAGERFDAITTTGYGRHLFAEKIGGRVVTEIRAAAVGARRLFPGCGTVLDIGGQDTKAIAVDVDGAVGRFEMNDECAAGTGRFVEVMAMALGATLDEFGDLAARGALVAAVERRGLIPSSRNSDSSEFRELRPDRPTPVRACLRA